jgi:hypothetical protein
MSQSYNPFEDDLDATPASTGGGHSNAGAAAGASRVVNNNPFDTAGDDDFYNNSNDDDQDYDQQQPQFGERGPPSSINQSGAFTDAGASFDGNDADYSGLQGQDASAEAQWQYLGDLPYRRVPIYTNVRWSQAFKSESEEEIPSEGLQHGLAAFPPSVVQHHPDMLDEREVRALLNTTTMTKVAGCPHGGPIAAVTLPIVGQSGAFTHAQLRIMTNAGMPLSTVEFPPATLERKYSPADITTIGFTDRYILMIVLRDSLCLTYNVHGEVVLQPFHILPRGEGKAFELVQANVYDGGVAVLSASKHSAIVELLDDHDPSDYFNGAHVAARRILPSSTATTEAFGGQDVLPPHYAIVTHLPTAAHAR